MESIRNYLDSMFASLPNTPQVLKAKTELGQMMEDKYQELISEGKTTNEAIGTVISEFGNLEELAETLGISKIQQKVAMEEPKREVGVDEVVEYLRISADFAHMIAVGVGLCIISVVGPILCGAFQVNDGIGVAFLLVAIAVAVTFFTRASSLRVNWKFIKEQPCVISRETVDYVVADRAVIQEKLLVEKTIGIVMCALCWVPAMLLDELQFFGNIASVDDIGGALLFVLVAFGVFLIVRASNILDSYKDILKINDNNTVSSTYVPVREREYYDNPKLNTFMSIYWPVITCVYLSWSFLSFDWHMTWIIWPVAAIIKGVIRNNLGSRQ